MNTTLARSFQTSVPFASAYHLLLLLH